MNRLILGIFQAEDDPGEALRIEDACREAGVSFHLRTVNDASQGTAYLAGSGEFADREHHPLPALVLLDLKMPSEAGFELLAWRRTQPHLSTIPVVAFTTLKAERDMKLAYDAGANSYLIKPSKFEDLVAMMKAIDFYWLFMNKKPET